MNWIIMTLSGIILFQKIIIMLLVHLQQIKFVFNIHWVGELLLNENCCIFVIFRDLNKFEPVYYETTPTLLRQKLTVIIHNQTHPHTHTHIENWQFVVVVYEVQCSWYGTVSGSHTMICFLWMEGSKWSIDNRP